LASTNFNTVEHVRNSIDDFIASKLPSFYRNRICMLPKIRRKVIETNVKYCSN
ncbi:hypothetical protein WH47_00605, partial [Habropoda laboriosa]